MKNIFLEIVDFWIYMKNKERFYWWFWSSLVISFIYWFLSLNIKICLVINTGLHLYYYLLGLLLRKMDKEVIKKDKNTLLPYIKEK